MKSGARDADDNVVETCQSCGAALPAQAQWCGQCYAVRGAAPVTDRFGGSVTTVTRPAPAASAPTTPMVKTRWRKTATTFGPLGRVIATIALVVPFLAFVAIGILTGGFTIAGAVIWGFVIMPWGLRDTWKAGQLPAR